MSINITSKQLNLRKQYLNRVTADVFFLCGEDEKKECIPAHKLLLAANSDVFETMFHGSLPEKGQIEIVDATPDGFRTFLRYFYFDEYMLTIDVVAEMMYLAKKYNVSDYFNICCQFLKERKIPKHILIGYELSIAHELNDLQQFFELQIISKYTIIFDSEYFLSVSRPILSNLLQIKHLDVFAKKLFDACMVWAKKACKNDCIDPNVVQNCRNKLGNCIQFIEFGAMTRDELVRTVMTYGDFFTSQELRRFIIMIAAKCPTPFNTDQIIKYPIGRRTVITTKIQCNSMGELHFNPRIKLLLGGIRTAHIFQKHNLSFKLYGIANVLKLSADKDKINDIILLRGSFEIICNDPNNEHEILFPEAVIVEPHSNYVIQVTFLHCLPNIELIKPYFKRSSSQSDEFPFRISSETNAYVISSLLYSRL